MDPKATTTLTSPSPPLWREVASWSARRWWTATATALLTVLVIGIPTDLIDTPWFGRETPPTSWAWPALVASATLTGLLAATYVAPPPAVDGTADRRGLVGATVTFFAVGCPVCNKLVLLALGYSGAVAWFEPVQPILAVGSVALLLWALATRVRRERACPVERRPGGASARGRGPGDDDTLEDDERDDDHEAGGREGDSRSEVL
ncbi:hypothetical protein [Paraoerskovia marina]|uniref:hypothetical protein n=1 Tax=Paraoerskovia marina TaxID=545619 RepID=UPI001B7FF68C|nr:hypothetical protein [Paraoerskovia marina]